MLRSNDVNNFARITDLWGFCFYSYSLYPTYLQIPVSQVAFTIITEDFSILLYNPLCIFHLVEEFSENNGFISCFAEHSLAELCAGCSRLARQELRLFYQHPKLSLLTSSAG